MTCGFGRSTKFFLTGLLGFLLGHLCDVDHMESRGAWCGTVLRGVRATGVILVDITRVLQEATRDHYHAVVCVTGLPGPVDLASGPGRAP